MAQRLSKLELDIPDLEKLEQQHFKKIITQKKIRPETVIKTKDKIFITAPKNNATCPTCNSTYFIKNGTRHNKVRIVQRYVCKSCGVQFDFSVIGFKGLRVKTEAIAQTMQLYFTGESIRNIAKFLQMQGIEISSGGVFYWIKKYVKLMKVFLDQFTPKVSDKWRCDEIYLKIQGKPKYLFVLMDDETRFVLAYYIADTKKTHKANKLFQMAITKAQKNPKIFTTDSMPSYKKAFGEVFDSQVTEHVRANYSNGTKWKNNLMERWNGTFRQRSKSFRAIKNMNSVSVDGFILYYNFIRDHMGINAIPSERAGIYIEDNKWDTLIQNATIEKEVSCQN